MSLNISTRAGESGIIIIFKPCELTGSFEGALFVIIQ